MHHDAASMPEGNGFGADSAAYVFVRWLQFIGLLLLIRAVAFRQFVLAFLRREQNAHTPLLNDAERGTARAGSWLGTLAVLLLVGQLPNLWDTRYGITLLVKLAVLGVLLVTAFYNWRFVKPRLGSADATVHLRRSARVT